MIDLYDMNRMDTEAVLNLYIQGHRLAEGNQYIRSLATPDVTCTTADTDPSHDKWFCYGYRIAPIVLGGFLVYLVMRKK